MTRRRTAVLALVLLGALAGCADDDGDPDSAPTATVTETVTSTPTTTATPTPSAPTPSPTETATTPAPSESGSAAPIDLSQPPTSYDEAAAHITAARGTGEQELDRFQSADDQFYCTFGERFIRPSCEILAGISDPATCGDSIATKVGRIELTKRGWRPFCNTDTVRQPGATVLAEGAVATWSEEGVACVLEGIGLTCVAPAGQQGFFLAPGRYEVF